MNLIDAANEALEVLQTLWKGGLEGTSITAHRTSIENLSIAIKAAEKSLDIGSEWTPCVKLPVVVHVRNQREGETHISTREGITPVLPDDLIMRGVAGEEYPIGKELFSRTYTFDTIPPQREWVGLTDDEIIETCNGAEFKSMVTADDYQFVLYHALEAKLREKNL